MSETLALPEGSGGDSSSLRPDFLLLHLSWLDNSPIAWALHDLFPPEKVQRWLYSPLMLLKLAIVQDKKSQLPYFDIDNCR